MQSGNNEVSQRSTVAGLIRAITLDAKNFFSKLLSEFGKIIIKNKFDVEVKNPTKLPSVFKIDGSVSLKDTKALLVGLNEIIKVVENTKKNLQEQTKQLEKSLKPEKVDFSELKKAIENIEIPEVVIPETIIPPFPKEIKISNFPEQVRIPEVSIPPFPKKIEISNFPDPAEEPKEEEMTGLVFKKDSNGNVSDIIEKYPSGNVVSSGWNLGVIKVSDGRKSS
jgi:hypothetical protein